MGSVLAVVIDGGLTPCTAWHARQGCSAALAILQLYPARLKRPVLPPLCAPACALVSRLIVPQCMQPTKQRTACRTPQQCQELKATWEKLLNETRHLCRPRMHVERLAATHAERFSTAPAPPLVCHFEPKLAAAAA